MYIYRIGFDDYKCKDAIANATLHTKWMLDEYIRICAASVYDREIRHAMFTTRHILLDSIGKTEGYRLAVKSIVVIVERKHE